jgi:hypothetical protein
MTLNLISYFQKIMQVSQQPGLVNLALGSFLISMIGCYCSSFFLLIDFAIDFYERADKCGSIFEFCRCKTFWTIDSLYLRSTCCKLACLLIYWD